MRVTFHTEFRDRTPPRDDRITELRSWCVRFHDLNLTPPCRGSSLGNLSFRVQEGGHAFIITASEVRVKDDPADDMFVTVHSCDPAKGIVRASGLKEPSSETMLHAAIYRERGDVGAVFHGHSDLLLRCGETLGVPVTGREEEAASPALVASVLDILQDETFIIMRNHGFLSLGRDMHEAGERAVRLYEHCRDAPDPRRSLPDEAERSHGRIDNG